MTKKSQHDADVIIVGAGVAGALIAYRLAKRGLKVFVFEAGQRFTRNEILKTQRSIWQQDNSSLYPNTPLAPRTSPSNGVDSYIENIGPYKYESYYLRGIGGTTWHWQAVCLRMLPDDMKLNSRYNVGIDWPISYEELEPYYAQADLELGVSGDQENDLGSPRSAPYPMQQVTPSYADQKIMSAMAKTDIKFNTKPAARNSQDYDGRPICVGHHNCSNMCPIGAQYSAIVHVEKAEKLGVKFVSEALVNRIKTGTDGTISSVSIKRSDGTTFEAAAKAFVIAANPLETVRLCLASTSEANPEGIANSSGMVGRRLMDHYNIAARFDAREPFFPGRGPLTSVATDKIRNGAFRKTQASALVTFENIDLVSEVATEALAQCPNNPRKIERSIRDLASRRLTISGSTEQLPQETNRVFLDRTKVDSSGMPKLQVYFDLDDYTKRGREAAQNLCRKVVSQLDGSNVKWTESFYAVHTSGTMMMGHDAKKFPTDKFGRTHDHKNLFIAGSSLFPSLSAVNPTLTIAALALRTEQEIASQLIH